MRAGFALRITPAPLAFPSTTPARTTCAILKALISTEQLAAILGQPNLRIYDCTTLYDGSMGEWARDASLPIETD